MNRYLMPIASVLAFCAFAGQNLRAAETSDKGNPSVTVFPVVTTPRNGFPDDLARRVGTVVATYLEKAGLQDLHVSETVFHPPQTSEVDQIATAFTKHVRENPVRSDYAVFAQFVGTPQSGVQAIRTVVLDKSGKVILAESAGPPEFAAAALHPQDPMSCCVFVSRRLQELWNLADPLRPNAPQGKMAQFWKKDAGIPDQNELDAIAARWNELRKHIQTATFSVYPVHVQNQSRKQLAVDLVSMFNSSGVLHAEVAQTDPALVIAAHSNEQKILWDTARSFRNFVVKNRPATDYAIYADYGLSGTNVHHVHTIICDRTGHWVLIDMQNSHQADFARIDPMSVDDCNRLLLVRIKSHLGE